MLTEFKQIVAIVPNWLGDAAMCTPALRALHKRYPEAELIAAGPASACALLHGLGFMARVHPLPKRLGFLALLRAAKALPGPHERAIVVFPHSFRAALLARFLGGVARIGYQRNWRSWLFTESVPPDRVGSKVKPIYMAKEYLALVTLLDCEDDGEGLELAAKPEAVAEAKERLTGEGPFVGFAPGAAFGPSKLWPAERYAKVIDALSEHPGLRCVLLTGPGEEILRDEILNAVKRAPLICDGGRPTIDSLKATISQLDLLVCNDSGPRHVAVAFGVPTVCIMGPTSPAYSEGPYERGKVLRIDVDCGPCQKPICATDHRCMNGIDTKWVVEAALANLPIADVS